MKKVITSLLMMVVLVSVSYGQQAIKVGPLGFLLGNYNLRYEKAIATKSSVQVGANFYDYNIGDFGTTGFGIDAGYRYYFKEAIKGPYVFPSLNYDFNSTAISSVDDTKGSFSNLGIGAQIGYQFVAKGGFVFDLGLGYGYKIGVSADDAFSDTRDFGTGGGLRFTFALGYAF